MCSVVIAEADKPRLSDNRDRTLHMAKGVGDVMGCTMPYLVTPTTLLSWGITISNEQNFPVKLAQGDRIATLMDDEIDAVYAVMDTVKFAYFQKYGKLMPEEEYSKVAFTQTQLPRQKQTRTTLLAAIKKIAPKLEPEQVATLHRLRDSQFAKYVKIDDRWEERILLTFKELRTGDAFTEEQSLRVKLICLAFCDRFFLDWSDTPPAKVDPMRITTVGKPVYTKARPIAHNQRDWFKEYMDELVENGILVRVYESNWASPVVVVSKRDGGWRACSDFRLLNNITVIPQFPIPRLEEMVQLIRGNTFLTAIDMKNAYLQLPLHEDDQHKTVQISHLGCYKFTRVPFGLSGAVAYFQARLKTLLDSIPTEPDQLLSNYLDDILVGGRTYEAHETCLIKFFEKFREVGLKIGCKKSLFGTSKIDYLGFTINAETRAPMEDRIEALMKREAPTDLKGLRGLISSLSFWNQFLPFMANQLEPLMEHLRQLQFEMGKKRSTSVKFKCSAEAEEAWNRIKALFAEKIFLYHIDPNTPFYIFADASDTAAGSVIMQKSEGKLRPVAFFSKVFTPPQRNYIVTEREFLAVMMTLEKYKTWLEGMTLIHIYTDHSAVVSIVTSTTETTPRMTRWRCSLSRFNIKWHFLPGKHHGAADFLSRPWQEVVAKFDALASQSDKRIEEEAFFSEESDAPMCLHVHKATTELSDLPFEKPKTPSSSYFEVTLGELSVKEILEEQEKDEFCQFVKQRLQNDFSKETDEEILASPAKSFAKRCSIVDGLVVAPNMLVNDTLVPVVPVSLQPLMLETAHNWDGAHLSAQKTYELIASRMAWPHLKKDTHTFVSKCNTCLQLRPGNSFQVEPGYFVATEVWDQVTIDVMHMQKRNSEFKLALVAIDTYSRYAIVMPLKGETAKEQMQALRNHVLHLGSPKTLVLDRHPVYTSSEFIEFCERNHIKLGISPGYSSNHVAIVNRVHRTLKELFAKLTGKGDDWTKEIARVTLAYNTMRHPATGFSPFFLFHARNPNLKIDKFMPQIDDRTSDEKRAANMLSIEDAKNEVLKKFEAIHKKQIAEFMRDHSKKKRDCPKVNERVFKILPLQKREGGKLAPVRAVGPYFIAKLEKDRIHALIVPQYRADDISCPGERVKINDLIPIGNRICTPVFANSDFALKNKK